MKASPTQPSNRGRGLFAVAIWPALLLLAIALFHYRGLLPGQTFLPVDLARNNYPWRGDTPHVLQNWLISDPLYELYPFLHSAVAAVQEGEIGMVWNPDIFLGHPALADPLAQSFYPVFLWFGLAFGAARGMSLGLTAHLFVAGCLMMAYAHLMVRDRLAALLAGITYALSGFLVTWFEHTNWVATLTFVPGVMWMVEAALQRVRLRYALGAAALLALTIVGGQFQFVVTLCAFVLVYALGRAWTLRREAQMAWFWPWPVIATTIGLGALLGGIAAAPFAEFLAESHRVRGQGLQDSLLLRQLTTLIFPDFYGNPSFTDYWGVRNYSEVTLYTGVVALFLAVVAILQWRHRWTGLVTLLTLLLLYFIFGGPGVSLLGTLPIIKYVSLSRSMFLLPLLVGLLAASAVASPRSSLAAVLGATAVTGVIAALALALQLEIVNTKWDALAAGFWRAGLLMVGTIALLLLRIGFPRLRRVVDGALVSLVFVDLLLWGWRFNPAGPIERLLPTTDGITYLQAHAAPYRVVALQRDDKTLFGPSILSVFGLAEPGGYTSAYSADLRELVRSDDPQVAVGWMAPNANILAFSFPTTRLLDLLHVKHTVALEPLHDPGIRSEQIQTECATAEELLPGALALAGRFSVRETAINRIDFALRRSDEVDDGVAGNGTLIFRLWEDAPEGNLVVESAFTVDNLGDTGSYTLYFSPLRDAPGRAYRWDLGVADGSAASGLALCRNAAGEPSLSVYGVDWAEVYADELYIAERQAPLPRAYVVYGVEVIENPEQRISRLLDEGFDVRRLAVVPQEIDLPPETDWPATTATVVEYRQTRVVLQGGAIQPGLLVLGDGYHPGWKATLNGERVPVIQTNHVQRGVLLPPGPYLVEFEFAPDTLRLGALASGVGLILLLGLWWVDRRRV